MKMRSWPFLLLGFGGLLALIGLSAAALHNRMEHVRADVEEIQRASEESDRALEELRSEIYLLAVLLRDYLLERSPEAAAQQRRTLKELRDSTELHMRSLQSSALVGERQEVQRLRTAIEEYWGTAEPAFEWTPEQKAIEGPAFLRRRLVPQRQTGFPVGLRDRERQPGAVTPTATGSSAYPRRSEGLPAARSVGQRSFSARSWR
jgi:hypothetical protein